MKQREKYIILPKKYVPKHLTKKDKQKWAKQINKTQKAYKKGKFISRNKVNSYKHIKSPHIKRALKIYNLEQITSGKTKKNRFKQLSKQTKCSIKALNKIYAKGSAAWFSGSRPNQTQQSWAVARVASAVSGGKSSYVDRTELLQGCKPDSKALKLMKTTPNRYSQKRKVKL